MTEPSHHRRPVPVPQSLGRLRRRLTAWYVGTFLVILLLLGVGLFATVTERFDSAMDASLREAATILAATVRERGVDAATRDLIIPDRQLFVLDSAGGAPGSRPVDGWIARFAERAMQSGAAAINHRVHEEKILRAYAVPFRAADGRPFVAVALGDEVEVEDKYAALIAVSGAAAVAALVLVGVGGWIVARQSTEPVERAIAHMRRFMADAAHELRTPLAVVRSRAEVALQRSREPAEYEDALKGIERESVRVGRIVEDLLTLARADAGERPIERRRVFLDDVTLDAAEAARALADRKSVRVDVDKFEESPVTGDPTLLRQLALILLDNAIKFSPETGGQIRVSVHSPEGRPTLIVADNGSGISAEQLPHVFERFYRGDAARTRTGAGGSEGAGLGLSIAQWIVDEHDATILVESEYGHGTRVTVQFPAASADALSSS